MKLPGVFERLLGRIDLMEETPNEQRADSALARSGRIERQARDDQARLRALDAQIASQRTQRSPRP